MYYSRIAVEAVNLFWYVLSKLTQLIFRNKYVTHFLTYWWTINGRTMLILFSLFLNLSIVCHVFCELSYSTLLPCFLGCTTVKIVVCWASIHGKIWSLRVREHLNIQSLHIVVFFCVMSRVTMRSQAEALGQLGVDDLSVMMMETQAYTFAC